MINNIISNFKTFKDFITTNGINYSQLSFILFTLITISSLLIIVNRKETRGN